MIAMGRAAALSRDSVNPAGADDRRWLLERLQGECGSSAGRSSRAAPRRTIAIASRCSNALVER